MKVTVTVSEQQQRASNAYRRAVMNKRDDSRVCKACERELPAFMYMTSSSSKCEDCALTDPRRKRRFIMTDDGTILKYCSVCGRYRSLSVFPEHQNCRGGLSTNCAECQRAYGETYRQTDHGRGRQKLATKAYYINHTSKDGRKRKSARLSARLSYALSTAREFNAELREAVGCSLSDWRRYMEGMFRDGMSWLNYGEVWCIDHANPRRNFDLRDPEQRKACLHWSNTRPVLNIESCRYHDDSCGRYGGLDPLPAIQPTYIPDVGELGPHSEVLYDEYGAVSCIVHR